MDRCPADLLQQILNFLARPQAFVTASRRLRAFAAEPYVRASYILARHGRTRAMFHALGRGDIVDGRVFEILIAAGAHVSRYLVQLAVKHYHNSQVYFIHKPWVRTLPFTVFVHFLELANTHLGGGFDPPRKKPWHNDATTFCDWTFERMKEVGSDREKELRAEVACLLEKWKLQPICDSDSIATRFELTLANEPDLLTIAMKNGYRINRDHRDFIFRRLFLAFKDHASNQTEKDALLSSLRELCGLRDPLLFVSRTVAAEVVMSHKDDADAYSALQILEQEGFLKFSVVDVTVDLIKSFATTRSVTDSALGITICTLYQSLPAIAAADTSIRHVVLVVVFISALTAAAAHAHFLELGLVSSTTSRASATHPHASVSRDELADVLASPFISSHLCVIGYARFYARLDEEMFDRMLDSVAIRCLTVSCKGEMLVGLTRRYQRLRGVVSHALLTRFALDLDISFSSDVNKPTPLVAQVACYAEDKNTETQSRYCELGKIGQATLSASYAKDFAMQASFRPYGLRSVPSRSERLASFHEYNKSQSIEPENVLLRIPRWIVETFGPHSAEAAVCAEHAQVLWCQSSSYEWTEEASKRSWRESGWTYLLERGVPITMRQWRIQARMGDMWEDGFSNGVDNYKPFYECAEEYVQQGASSQAVVPLPPSTQSSANVKTKISPSRAASPNLVGAFEQRVKQEDAMNSVELGDAGQQDAGAEAAEKDKNRAMWVKALSLLHKQELLAYNERKKHAYPKHISKPRFLTVLATRLSGWRKEAKEKKRQLLAKEENATHFELGQATQRPKRRKDVVVSNIGNDGDDDADSDYVSHRAKKRKVK